MTQPGGGRPHSQPFELAAVGLARREMGCVIGQGFVIARPMPSEDIPRWAEGWTPPVPWRRPPEG